MGAASIIEKILEEREPGELLGLFFDFDGTISEIVESPDEAVILPGARDSLGRLANFDDVAVGVISGREIEDLKDRVGVPGIIYSGNHGAQLEMMGKRYTLTGREELGNLGLVAGELSARLIPFPGTILEHKNFSVSLHTRMVDDSLLPDLKILVREAAGRFAGLAVREGKRVLEIFPADSANKGEVLRFILKKIEETSGFVVFPVYFGDDKTDKYVYDYLREKRKGVSVFVKGADHLRLDADFELGGPSEVVSWMADLIEAGVSRGKS